MAEKLWGGRFEKQTDPRVEEFTRSIHYDQKLVKYDIIGSILHIEILEKSNYLLPQEAVDLKRELLAIYKTIKNENFVADSKCEDIHTQIQNILQEKLGETALKLHMARSRNDQVVFAIKFYCKAKMAAMGKGIEKLVSAIDGTIGANNDIVIPGFTHMQHAQPVYLKDYLGAYSKMLERDKVRLCYIRDNMKITMGAGALAGTPIMAAQYNVDANKILLDSWKEFSELLNVEPPANSLDSVSDRDFVIEIISALSIIATHLSRLSEDLIIWSTKEFDFIEIDEAFCTGSSLMPQKKNPDVLELVRGYAGRLCGNLVSVLMMMKGLPLTYNRDMQLDKEPLFNSFEIVGDELEVLAGLIKTLKFNKVKIEKHLEDESLYATDLVYYLVKRGEPFKSAHTIIGELIKYSIDNNIPIKSIPEDVLKEKFSDKFIKEGMEGIVRLFDPKISVESKLSIKRDN